MAQSTQSDSTQYHAIEAKTDDHFVVEELTYELTQRPPNRSWTSTILLQAFALLWLVPTAALLWLNATDYVVGASAWCPGGKCYREVRIACPRILSYVPNFNRCSASTPRSGLWNSTSTTATFSVVYNLSQKPWKLGSSSSARHCSTWSRCFSPVNPKGYQSPT